MTTNSPSTIPAWRPTLFPDGVRVDLELLDERRFGDGTVLLRYATKA